MSNLTKESIIVTSKKEYVLVDVLNKLIYLDPKKVTEFFSKIGFTVPRALRIGVLKDVLRDQVQKTRYERRTLADELNYRLSWFNEFTELQLENLLIFYDKQSINLNYYETLWIKLIDYMIEKSISKIDLEQLFELAFSEENDKLYHTKTYNETINPIFFDEPNTIDGQSLEKIRPVLYKSSTVNEIRELGSKYKVDVPRRLKKAQLAEIILGELKDRGELTDKLEKEIKDMSVIIMQRFAKDHNIKASTELKKEEVIEFVLANANQTKEAYYEPSSEASYNLEVQEIGEALEEIEEPIVEEVIEEVKEEPIEEIVEEVKAEPVSEEIITEEVVIEDDLPLVEPTVVEEVIEDEVIEEVVVSVEEEVVDKTPYIINTATYVRTRKEFNKVGQKAFKPEKVSKTHSAESSSAPVVASKVREKRSVGRFFMVLANLLVLFALSMIFLVGLYVLIKVIGWDDHAFVKSVLNGIKSIINLFKKFWDLIF